MDHSGHMPATSSDTSMDMDMSGQDGHDASMPMSMTMVFFTGTNTPLFSEKWTPSTTGQYAGTCIFLIIFAIVFRILLALKARQEAKWVDAELNRRYISVAGRLPPAERPQQNTEPKKIIITENGVEEEVLVIRRRDGAVQPWRITTDPLRAIIDTVIAGVGYLL